MFRETDSQIGLVQELIHTLETTLNNKLVPMNAGTLS